MRRFFKLTFVLLLTAFAASQAVRPERSNPPSEAAESLANAPGLPAGVAAILDRSCRDCHSNQTRWPWYSHVAPASWLVIDHVNHGRSHFNYSTWRRYTPAEQAKLLEGSCELAQRGAMPMPSYLLLHRSAALSPADVATLCSWSAPAPAH